MSTLTEAVTAYEAQLNTVVGTFVAANAAAEGNAALTAADRIQTGEDRIAASGSAADALASQNAASDKAAEALGYLQAYRATSYGALAADPALDPLGNAPTAGDEYFNTTSNLLKRFNGTAWQVPDINTTNLAAAGGAGMVGTMSSADGAILRTQAEVNEDGVHLFEFIPESQQAAILAGTSVYDATVPLSKFIAACVARKKIGQVPGGKICYQALSLPAGFPGMAGEGDAATNFQHIAGTSGPSVKVPVGRLNYSTFSNLCFTGYGAVGENAGIDLTGISYSEFTRVKVTGFYEDNWTGTGFLNQATGVDRSTIVNNFYGCIGGSSVTGRGINVYAPLDAYDTTSAIAWTFFGGYFVANAAGQIRARFGEDIHFVDSKIEASTGGLIDIDDCSGFNFRGYVESRNNNLYIYTGPNSKNHEIVPTRWSYPLWHMLDPASTTGQGRIHLAGCSPGRACFDNPDLATLSFVGTPLGLVAVGGMTFTGCAADTESNKGVSFGVSAAAAAAAGGFDIVLSGTASRYFGKRVTLRMRYKSTGGAGLTLTVYPRVAALNIAGNGAYYSRGFKQHGTQAEILMDLVFPPKGVFNDSDAVSVRVVFNAFPAAVTMNIDELQVNEGGFAYAVGEPFSRADNPSVQLTATLLSLAGWPNLLKKVRGRLITDVETLKTYVATGGTPASAWKEIATGVLITPT
jgi:hypothetical protein